MAEPDDIEKLLREIDAMDAGKQPGQASTGPSPAALPPADSPKGKDVAKTEKASKGARAQWTAVATAGAGAAGLVVGSVAWFIPWVGTMQTGLGAALGGALVAAVSGPPGWFKQG